jgi:hypothetical protein
MNKTKKILLIAAIVLVVVLVISGVVWRIKATQKPAFLAKLLSGGNTGAYYVVFVQTGNGATSYYGHIIDSDRETVTLSQPGYIDVQPAAKEGEQPQISFRQMKDDFFKPLPEIKIYKNNIVFVQELSVDSPIISAYKNIK